RRPPLPSVSPPGSRSWSTPLTPSRCRRGSEETYAEPSGTRHTTRLSPRMSITQMVISPHDHRTERSLAARPPQQFSLYRRSILTPGDGLSCVSIVRVLGEQA